MGDICFMGDIGLSEKKGDGFKEGDVFIRYLLIRKSKPRLREA